MKRFRYALPCLLLVLAACKTAPTSPTFNDLVKYAASLDDAVLVTGNALFVAGAISTDQSKKVLAITDRATALLTAANTAYVAGNTALASRQLSAANSSLAAAQGCLSQKPGAPAVGTTVDACLNPLVEGAP